MTLSFAADVSKFAEKFKLTLDEAHRGIVLSVFTDIIMNTPRDTGRAAANWVTNVGSPKWSEVPAVGVTASLESLNANLGHIGDTVYISNGLPYIWKLEYGGYPNPPIRGSWVKSKGYVIKSIGGYSKQAPAGMVRVAFARINTKIEEVARGLKA